MLSGAEESLHTGDSAHIYLFTAFLLSDGGKLPNDLLTFKMS